MNKRENSRIKDWRKWIDIPSRRIVDEELFRLVYDSPASLPGKEKW